MTDSTLPSLDAIQARANAATNGPWEVNGPDERWAAISSGPDSVIHAYTEHASDCVGCTCERDADVAISAEDAEFIAAARTDVPALVAALRAVLDLHRPEAWRGTGVLVCAHCRPAWTGSNRATYPCDTVRAITAHIDTTPKEKP